MVAKTGSLPPPILIHPPPGQLITIGGYSKPGDVLRNYNKRDG